MEGGQKWCFSCGRTGLVFGSLQLLLVSWVWLLFCFVFFSPVPHSLALPQTGPRVIHPTAMPDAQQGGHSDRGQILIWLHLLEM